ncbi:hypothetical protein Lbir_2164 [Legionella birminghamensis]|uniref:DNA 3'-5' helicase II n=1 Tax=Legionella birminghamensis TaxID=28083 RepID=A0A378I9Z8_9GAMM|nr:hypothetical protein [Legionella birminghamensis]KTC69425.1 hypothetical protein Lbir_2164 [Legionella birminghamensis]STX31666.1 Uncharacterised protein [Legionella birminghamensis]
MVDEAQDLSRLPLKEILHLAKEKRVCYLMDTHQSLFDNKSKRPYLLGLMGSNAKHIELPHSYRCPANVVHFANRVIRLKNWLVGGRADKLEQAEIIPSPEQEKIPGTVVWVDKEEEFERLKEAAKESDFAIITLPQYVEEARRKYGSALIFTPEQIKGLEYKKVLLYRMLDDELCYEANKKINGLSDEELNCLTNRAKEGCEEDQFGPPFNKFFTSCTRSTADLYIDQPEKHATRNLTRFFKKGIKAAELPVQNKAPKTEAERLADWTEEARRQYEEGNIDISKNIYEQCLKNKIPQADFESFLIAQKLVPEKIEAQAWPEPEIKPEPKPEPNPAAEEQTSEACPRKKKKKRSRKKAAAEPRTTAGLSLQPRTGAIEGKTAKPAKNSAMNVSPLQQKTVDKLITVMEQGTIKEWQNYLQRKLSCPVMYQTLVQGLAKQTNSFEVLNFIKEWKALLQKEWGRFSEVITNELLAEELTKHIPEFRDVNVFYFFAMDIDFVSQRWDFFKSRINEEMLNKRIPGGVSAFYLLCGCGTDNKAKLRALWKDLAGFVTKENLHQICADSPYKGASSFYWLCSDIGIEILDQYWHIFMPSITKELLFQEITGSDETHEGKSPLYRLCIIPEGIKFLDNHWDFFEPFFSEEIFKPLGNKHPLSIFQVLFYRNGIELIKKHWPHFLSLIQKEMQSPDERVSEAILFGLSSSPEGVAFLEEKWDFFKSIINEKSFIAKPYRDYPSTGISCIYHLCTHPEGLAFLNKHWSDFAPYLKKTHLSEHFTGSRQTPLHLICDYAERVALIDDHWDDFARFITEESLHLPITGSNTSTGKTPFYFLCQSGHGINLIQKHWDFFEPLITAEALKQTATGAVKEKGLSVLHLLFRNAAGLELLDTHWDFFEPLLITQNLLNVTVNHANQRITPIRTLLDSKEGRILIQKRWPLFSRPFVSEGENISFFYWLCSTSYGHTLLKEYWEEFAHLFTKKDLHTPFWSKTYNREITIFENFLCVSGGAKLIYEKWETFEPLVGDKEINFLVSFLNKQLDNQQSSSPQVTEAVNRNRFFKPGNENSSTVPATPGFSHQ